MIEPETLKLQRTVGSSGDFEAVQRAHDTFVRNVVRRSFTDMKVVRTALHGVLRACAAFCGLISQHRDVSEIPPSRFREAARQFRQQSFFLLAMLRRAPGHEALALRIDFNGFFSQNASVI